MKYNTLNDEMMDWWLGYFNVGLFLISKPGLSSDVVLTPGHQCLFVGDHDDLRPPMVEPARSAASMNIKGLPSPDLHGRDAVVDDFPFLEEMVPFSLSHQL